MTEEKEKRYNIFVIEISEPELFASNLIKEECDVKIKDLMNNGVAPDRIKVRRIS
tara:strand:+ start:18 stop:182 length:165 start_codon:yes stop_codon:yes gene_type:complete